MGKDQRWSKLILLLLFFVFSVSTPTMADDDVRLSTVRRVNVSYDPNESQVFTFTNQHTVVWSNLREKDKFFILEIYKGIKLDVNNRIFKDLFTREDIMEKYVEKSLPELDNGEYLFVFFATHELVMDDTAFAAPFGMYQMRVSVSGGQCRFTEPVLTPGSDTAKQLERTAEAYLEGKQYVGVSIGIVKDSRVLFLNYGESKAGGSKINEHSLFSLGSVTKTFTGTILADLANQKKLI